MKSIHVGTSGFYDLLSAATLTSSQDSLCDGIASQGALYAQLGDQTNQSLVNLSFLGSSAQRGSAYLTPGDYLLSFYWEPYSSCTSTASGTVTLTGMHQQLITVG